MDEREMVGAPPLRKTIGWGRSPKWANWVHVNNVVSRWLDSGLEVADNHRGIQWLSGADTQEYVQQDGDHHLLMWCNHHWYIVTALDTHDHGTRKGNERGSGTIDFVGGSGHKDERS